MDYSSRILLSTGIIFLLLTILNATFASNINPSFLRAEVLSSIASVALMLIAFLWSEGKSTTKSQNLQFDNQGLIMEDGLTEEIRNELGWGSHLLLTATPAATLIIYWDHKVLIRRGLISNNEFIPGTTCLNAQKSKRLISLPNTKFFPAKYEFDCIVKGLPSLIIYPLDNRGWVILGGCVEKCFSKSDEKWITGWSERLKDILIKSN